MQLESIVTILMRRDGLSRDAAQDAMDDAIEQVKNGADPEDVLHYEFGLEPDYIFDLLGGM